MGANDQPGRHITTGPRYHREDPPSSSPRIATAMIDAGLLDAASTGDPVSWSTNAGLLLAVLDAELAADPATAAHTPDHRRRLALRLLVRFGQALGPGKHRIGAPTDTVEVYGRDALLAHLYDGTVTGDHGIDALATRFGLTVDGIYRALRRHRLSLRRLPK